MNEKKLIFDVVFITDSEEIFELRFKELYNLVDYFIIFGTKDSLKKLKKYYGVIDHKIKTFVIEGNIFTDFVDKEYVLTAILETTQELYTNFEDLVFISFSNEIPDIKNIDDNQIKSKEIKILKNDVYECNFERKRKFKETGSVLVNFSYLLKNKKNFLNDFLDIKTGVIPEDATLFNGYKILNYQKRPKKLPSVYYCAVSKKYVEYQFKKTPRKFVFTAFENVNNLKGDHVFKLKFNNIFPEKLSIDFSESEHTLELFLPKNLLYGENFDEFEKIYKYNEIKRILSVFDCQDGDEIEINLNEENRKKFKFHEIKNPSI